MSHKEPNTMNVHKVSIPVDDQWHEVLIGKIVHVACQYGGSRVDTIEVWFENQNMTKRHFRVFGTGHKIPDWAWHAGTGLAANGSLVWHLYEKEHA